MDFRSLRLAGKRLFESTPGLRPALLLLVAVSNACAPAVAGRTLEIGNPGYTAGRIEGRRLSLFFDCGSSIGGARADRYQVTASVMVQISVGDGGTLVRTRVGATAKQRNVSGNAVPCQSRRRLERRILELIGEELASEAGR